MTVTHRKRQRQPDEIIAINEPGMHIECDACSCDLTHSIRIKCADPVCEEEDGVDMCPACFCSGKEFSKHKRGHPYRVVEIHSYPIFSEDWGPDEELLLIEGIASQGIGNWLAIADHIGTRSKEEVEEHYNSVYVDSPDWPLPKMDVSFDIEPKEFQERKRRRILARNTAPVPPPKPAPTSTPGVHEIQHFLPGRLEFEHELDNEAEDLIKDLEFGICLEWGGDEIPEDENDVDVNARAKWDEERRGRGVNDPDTGDSKETSDGADSVQEEKKPLVNGNGHATGPATQTSTPAPPLNGHTPNPPAEETTAENGSATEGDAGAEEVTQPLPLETKDSLRFKLALIEIYGQRVGKRREAKAVMFDRGLLEYKKMQAAEKKRPKEEKDIVNRLRPFARLQTAEDYEAFSADILYEAMLRKRIQDLQHYRRMGLMTAADVDKYDQDCIKRAQAKANFSRDLYGSERFHLRGPTGRSSLGPSDDGRKGDDRELTPKSSGTGSVGPVVRKPPQPLNLANSPSLHLLTPAEQTLCSQLRILPKPYLVIKETLVREYARRGGKLRRREARDLVKIDVNKTSRVWDFLVQTGYLKINIEPTTVQPNPAPAPVAGTQTQSAAGPVNAPVKDAPRPVPAQAPVMNGTPSTSSASPSIPPSAVPPWPPN